jgi:dihydrodipicolinate synthase/N-acetylneuraminate lyase
MVLEGVNAAAVTPRRPNGLEIDLSGAFELIDFLCESGIKGIAALGSTGEYIHFPAAERSRFIAMCVKRSRVPVIAGISDASYPAALEMARRAACDGAAAVLLMPPYFFRYTQPQLKEFFLRFRDELGDAAPLLIYNVPFFTTPLAVETSLELLETGLFAGIKDSSGDYDAFVRLKALCDRRPFRLLIGNDVVFTRARSAGAHGVVSGCACAVPEMMLGLDRAIQAGDQARVDTLEKRLGEFISWLNRFPVPIGIKEALNARGISCGPPTIPLPAAEERTVAEYHEWFLGWLPDVKKEAATES